MIEYFFLIAGFALLIKGADFLVDGSSSLAKRLRVSTLIIGLTIVAFGTSMPELVVNILAAIKNLNNIAVGNIIGSNIANILLVLGITALIYPVKIRKSTIWKEIPFGILAAIVLLIVANDKSIDNITSLISRTDALVMLVFLIIFVYYIYEAAKKKKIKIEKEIIEIKKRNIFSILGLILLGILFLYLGGKFTVENAVVIASNLGVSNYLISSIIIALGTSLPELITSITASLKKDIDMAVGNVVGSNIFNIFWILGITATISPIKNLPSFINFDIIFLIGASCLLFIFALSKQQLGKKKGIILLILYVTYILIVLMRG